MVEADFPLLRCFLPPALGLRKGSFLPPCLPPSLPLLLHYHHCSLPSPHLSLPPLLPLLLLLPLPVYNFQPSNPRAHSTYSAAPPLPPSLPPSLPPPPSSPSKDQQRPGREGGRGRLCYMGLGGTLGCRRRGREGGRGRRGRWSRGSCRRRDDDQRRRG